MIDNLDFFLLLLERVELPVSMSEYLSLSTLSS